VKYSTTHTGGLTEKRTQTHGKTKGLKFLRMIYNLLHVRVGFGNEVLKLPRMLRMW
jgi:hypothetical protein